MSAAAPRSPDPDHTMEPEVRRAARGDAAGIARCQGQAWREAYGSMVPAGFFDDSAEGIGTARWEQAVDAAGVDVAVAVRGGRVVGFASAGPADPRGEPDGSAAPTGRRLHAIYLLAQEQGTGVADRLLTTSLGTGAAHLWVFRDNPRARAFYARHGFAPDGAEAVDDWTGLVEVRLVR